MKKIHSEVTPEAIAKKDADKEALNDIEKTKIVLDYVDNPKLLWKHLKTQIKNMFIQRYILQKQMLKQVKECSGANIHRIVSKLPAKCEFAVFLKSKMKSYNDDLSTDLPVDMEAHVLKLVKEAFKFWFYLKISQDELDAQLDIPQINRRESMLSENADDMRMMTTKEFFN